MNTRSKKIWIGVSILGAVAAGLTTALPIALISKNDDRNLQNHEVSNVQVLDNEALFMKSDTTLVADTSSPSIELNKVANYKFPELPMSERVKISYDNLPFENKFYSEDEFLAIIKDLGIDLVKDYNWPAKQLYNVDVESGKTDYVERKFKFKGVDEETGVMDFEIDAAMQIKLQNISGGEGYWMDVGASFWSYKVPLFQSSEYSDYLEDIEKDLVKFDDIDVGLAIENNYEITNFTIGDKLGETSIAEGSSGKIANWEFAYGNKSGSLEEIIGEIDNPELTRKYYVDKIYESGVLDLRVEVWKADRHESTILKIGDFLNSSESKDQVEFDAEKFLPYQTNPLVLANKISLPEVGETLGYSSKLDLNYDGVYKYQDDYRFEGKINSWEFINGDEIDSIDHTVGPATWLTSRQYKVISVNHQTGEALIEVTISSNSYTIQTFFWISGFMSEADNMDRINFDAAKFKPFYERPAKLATPQPLPKVGDYLGQASKLDEDGDGQYKYHDDYRRSGIINEWQFWKNRTDDVTLDHLIGPASWLTAREYKVAEVDPQAGVAEIEVLISCGNWHGYAFFKISNFIPEDK